MLLSSVSYKVLPSAARFSSTPCPILGAPSTHFQREKEHLGDLIYTGICKGSPYMFLSRTLKPGNVSQLIFNKMMAVQNGRWSPLEHQRSFLYCYRKVTLNRMMSLKYNLHRRALWIFPFATSIKSII